jgi:hypothetical protein
MRAPKVAVVTSWHEILPIRLAVPYPAHPRNN